MKIAILADMHGNAIALDAVLADIQRRGGVEAYWLLGDYVAIGPDPLGVLERLSSLHAPVCIRGNTDHYVAADEVPLPSLAEVVDDPSRAPQYLQMLRSFAWTAGAVGAGGWLPWLQALPVQQHISLPDGTTVLAVHAAPGTDDGHGISPHTSDEELHELVSEVAAAVVLVGHTHLPFDRTAAGVRVLNPGSVSNPFPPDLRASYLWLEADGDGHRFSHQRVAYDRDAVLRAVQAVQHPAASYIARFMRGTNQPAWLSDATSTDPSGA